MHGRWVRPRQPRDDLCRSPINRLSFEGDSGLVDFFVATRFRGLGDLEGF